MINIIFLLFFLAISSTEAAVSCDSSSSQCCSVVRIWELMGKTTSVSSTSSNDCCNMEGVTCTGPDVTQINWNKLGLTQQIPSDIRNLVNLQEL
jgi:hypothetical protein